MSNKNINFTNNIYGVYIPWNEILLRTHYQWFSYLSVDQVLECNNNLGNLILVASSKNI